jgi:hypothetical protein
MYIHSYACGGEWVLVCVGMCELTDTLQQHHKQYHQDPPVHLVVPAEDNG